MSSDERSPSRMDGRGGRSRMAKRIGMKIALLVLASGAPAVLDSHAAAFEADPDVHFFVHLDAKASLADFAAPRSRTNVTFLAARLPIFWGGFNMVRAEIALLRAALAAPSGFDELALISDDSYCLRSGRALKAALPAAEAWIDQNPIEPAQDYPRYARFYCLDAAPFTARHLPVEERHVTEADSAEIAALEALRARGKAPLTRLYHGAQWWCLQRAVAAFVVAAFDEGEHVRDSFRFSAIPDETCVQTIVGLSGRPWTVQRSPMFYDFSRDPKPFVFAAPSELEDALRSPCLFVRKIAADERLLEALKAGVRAG